MMALMKARRSPEQSVEPGPAASFSVFRMAFTNPRLVGLVHLRGTRTLAKYALPLLGRRLPWVLRPYLRAENVDFDHSDKLTRTVENPVAAVNEQIARWFKTKDLIVNGSNLTQEMKSFTGPFLCVYGNADLVVPRKTALATLDYVGSEVKDAVELGSSTVRMAHADPYISRYSHEMVFQPIMDWLLGQS